MPDISEPDNAREITVLQKFDVASQRNFKDLSPRVMKVEDEEAAEVEEAITPVPKDESVPESVPSPVSPPPSEPPASENPAPVAPPLPSPNQVTSTVPEDADSESGKLNAPNEDELSRTENEQATQLPEQDSSSQSSSSETNPGSAMPPAPVVPPTSAKTPKLVTPSSLKRDSR